MKREILDPRWANEQKTQIIAKFKLEDGNIVSAAISKSDNGTNPDWDEIMETFGPDVLQANLEKDLQEHRRRKADREEQQKFDMENAMREALFTAKSEAFEIEAVKNSTNKELKNNIRRASSIIEVAAFTAMLMMSERQAANTDSSSA